MEMAGKHELEFKRSRRGEVRPSGRAESASIIAAGVGATGPGGAVRRGVSDPFRGASLSLLEALEGDDWRITATRWDVGEETTPRTIGDFELDPPRSGESKP